MSKELKMIMALIVAFSIAIGVLAISISWFSVYYELADPDSQTCRLDPDSPQCRVTLEEVLGRAFMGLIALLVVGIALGTVTFLIWGFFFGLAAHGLAEIASRTERTRR